MYMYLMYPRPEQNTWPGKEAIKFWSKAAALISVKQFTHFTGILLRAHSRHVSFRLPAQFPTRQPPVASSSSIPCAGAAFVCENALKREY